MKKNQIETDNFKKFKNFSMKKRLKILNPKDFFNFEFKLQMMLFRVRIHFIFALCGFSLLMLSSLMCISKQSKFNYFKMSKSENFSNSYINENVLFTSNEVILKNLTVDDEILTVFVSFFFFFFFKQIKKRFEFLFCRKR